MEGDLLEESERPVSISGVSRYGHSTNDTHIFEKHMSESLRVDSAAGENNADLAKLDSNPVKINVGEDDPFKHLPANEASILERQVYTHTVKIGMATLYRYATTNDLIIIAISCVCSIAGGAALPLMTVIFGQLAGIFQGLFSGTIPASEFNVTLAHNVLYFVYLAVAEFITVYISTVGFIYTGEHISGKIREKYLEACLRQNIAFYDKLGAGEITTRIIADTNLVQDGISEKVGLTLAAVATFVTAFVIGFVKFWKLTLILCSTVVSIVVIMGVGSSFIFKYNKKSLDAYALGGTVAEEVISSIRNATAFGTQDKLAKQYDTHLIEAEKYGRKVKITMACMLAGVFPIISLNYGLAFWQGAKFLVNGETTLSSILTILLAILSGAFSLSNVAPNTQAFITSVSAAAKLFNTIDRVSPLDPSSEEGMKLEYVDGTIELLNIKHIYPSRPEVCVMHDVSLIFPAGKKTALVGASGSGKSTVIGLVERFYNPVGGQVLLDGHDVTTLNVRWLRRQISLVSQEPILFGTTIFENIKHGLIGTKYEQENEAQQKELILDAAKMANAHDFISNLPEAYDTNVGERGSLLSGGQKQRIAIARAIVSNPKILLLDEATSALDTQSEGIVQAALEVAAAGRTTIIIAHRLSTIKDVDNIVVMAGGSVIEQGTHNELLGRRSAYYRLIEAQKIEDMKEATLVKRALLTATNAKVDSQALETPNPQRYLEDPDDKKVSDKFNHIQSEKPTSSIALQERPAEVTKQYSTWTLIKLITSFNRSELHFMIIGLLCSIISGLGNPTQAVFFAEQIVTLSGFHIEFNAQQVTHKSDFWSLMYLMSACVQFTALVGQGCSFAFCSERLIHRLRESAFRVMLRQDIGFFDQEENTAGALTSFLSTETTFIAGLSGVTLGTLLTVATTLIAAISLSLGVGWKLTLVTLPTIPVVLACGFLRFYVLARFQQRAKKAYQSSASYACEATSAIRTVASLTREVDVLRHYQAALAAQAAKSLRSVLKTSILYAASQSLTFLCMALGFWYGGTLIARGEYSLLQFFICYPAIIFGAQSAGTFFSFAPDMGKSQEAARTLKTLLDRKPPIDTWSTDGARLDSVKGGIEFRNVHFRYPTRPEEPVLQGLDLIVKPGQYVALVGASGCGKSTTIALLERFYDPLVGGVYVDGKDISTLDVNHYRSILALVSQEPTLYQGTIRENVLLGTNRNDVPEADIIFACKEANIYTFIMSLPEGLSTVVGSKGCLLSGGQKQRIAIARALLRAPKILLLDEATSALDSESEHIVQAALDTAAKGRTTIAVAHRLSTIQKADVIYVFDQGRIVEHGTHSELIDCGGRYSELVNLQSLGKTV